MEPIYTSENCRFAYQLNWSLSIFARGTLPPAMEWLDRLKSVTEPDGVRILESRQCGETTSQFLVSTQPQVPPREITRSIKGRLQHLVGDRLPRAFRRNYHLRSVGSTKRETVEAYVTNQLGHHRMADERVQDRLTRHQLHRPEVNLGKIRSSAHGQFVYNLHLVFVRRERSILACDEILGRVASSIERASRQHGRLLSAAAILADHIHLTVGCNLNESPLAAALSYLNNLAYAEGMKAVYEYGGYLGTFGEFDLGAVRSTVERERAGP